jgi:hypothetical protein
MSNIDTALVALGSTKVPVTTASVTIVLGYSLGDWAAIIGIFATTVALGANLIFKAREDLRKTREDERQQLEHQVHLKEIRKENGCET